MRPVLFEIAGRPFPSYGIAIALAFAVGSALVIREGKRRGLPTEGLADLLFWTLVAGIVGSRVLFVALNFGEYVTACRRGAGGSRGFAQVAWDCTAALRLWEGGLVFYGGMIATLVTTILFVRKRRWSFVAIADILVPAIALGHAIGRLGCFAAGCCFGKPCAPGSAGCAAFPPGSIAFDELQRAGIIDGHAHATPLLRPTQIYEATADLLLFGVLIGLRRRNPRPGTLTTTYFLLYALLRFTVELFRGDAARGFVARLETPALAAWLGFPVHEPLFLSTSQALALAVMVVAAGLLWWRWRRATRSAEAMA